MNVRLFLLIACIVVAACSSRGGYYEDDGPPSGGGRIDLAKLEDPVPRREPLAKTGNDPYTVMGQTYHPLSTTGGYRERGVASWYGKKFHGNRTSSGEPYDMYAMTAAHRTLPIPSYVRVRNLSNNRTAIVRVNDRGPFLHNRLIDLSYAAAYKLGIIGTGTGLVEVTAIEYNHQLAPVRSAPIDNRRPEIYLQLGAYADPANAIRMQNELRGRGYGATVSDYVKDGLKVHRVRVGPITTVDEADRVSSRMRGAGLNPHLVVD